jgi:hypothetical protein
MSFRNIDKTARPANLDKCRENRELNLPPPRSGSPAAIYHSKLAARIGNFTES